MVNYDVFCYENRLDPDDEETMESYLEWVAAQEADDDPSAGFIYPNDR